MENVCVGLKVSVSLRRSSWVLLILTFLRFFGVYFIWLAVSSVSHSSSAEIVS